MIDRELVLKAKSGDISAFEEIVVKLQSRLFSFCLSMVKNTQDAEDITQDTLVKIYRSLSFFKEDSSFLTWAFAIARNTTLDFLRKSKRKNETTLFDDEPSSTYSPENLYLKKEALDEIQSAIFALPQDMREILLLREIGGLSYQEIAETIHTEIGTVKSRIARAREKLCISLGNNFPNHSSNITNGGGI